MSTADLHVIHSGQEIMQLTLNDYQIRLIDSLNFLQMPLSKFPATFGFRNTFLNEKGVDPFCYCTIAASVMAVYRSKYLKENTIGIVPKNLYRNSNVAQTNSKILHACNGGEKMTVDEELGKTYFVDGFCEETNEVFDYFGCVFSLVSALL